MTDVTDDEILGAVVCKFHLDSGTLYLEKNGVYYIGAVDMGDCFVVEKMHNGTDKADWQGCDTCSWSPSFTGNPCYGEPCKVHERAYEARMQK